MVVLNKLVGNAVLSVAGLVVGLDEEAALVAEEVRFDDANIRDCCRGNADIQGLISPAGRAIVVQRLEDVLHGVKGRPHRLQQLHPGDVVEPWVQQVFGLGMAIVGHKIRDRRRGRVVEL